MKQILRRYAIREIALPTALALVTLIFILLIRVLYELINLVLQPGVSVFQVLGVLASFMPGVALFALPMALLIGVLIGIGRMTMDREILAIRAGGVHLMWVFAPALLLAFLMSVGVWVLSCSFVPAASASGMNRVARLQFALMNTLEPGRLYDELSDDDADVVLYFHEREAETRRMRGVTLKFENEVEIARADGGEAEDINAPVMIFAESGEILSVVPEDADSRKTDASIVLTLRNGAIHYLDPDPTQRDYTTIRFETLEKILFTPTSFEKEYKMMSNRRLGAFVRDEQAEDEHRTAALRELVERRVMWPASFVFALIAVPLAIMVRPSGKSWGIMIAIGLMLVYFVQAQLGLSMVHVGGSLGQWLAFSPNIVFGLVGAGLWWHTLRS